MKATVQVKDEPVDVNYSNDTVNELLRLYGYTLTDPSAAKSLKITSPRTKSTLHAEQERKPCSDLRSTNTSVAVCLATTCAWCQKLGVRSFSLRTDNGDSKTLCSEVCFNHYRRASFKKNKVCRTTRLDSSTDRFSSSCRVPNRSLPSSIRVLRLFCRLNSIGVH